MDVSRYELSAKVEYGAVNAECDDRITSEIGYYGDVLDPFAEKHDHKDAGKRGYIELSDISCIAVGAHSGGGSSKIHDGKGHCHKQWDPFIETVRK